MRLWPLFGFEFATLLVMRTPRYSLESWMMISARIGSPPIASGTARQLQRYGPRREQTAHPPACARPPPRSPAAQLAAARREARPGPTGSCSFRGSCDYSAAGQSLLRRLGPEPTDRVRGGARQNSQQLVPRPPDPPPVRDAPPPRALYFAPSLQPRSPASASAASAHRAAGRQLSTQPAGAGRGARLR